MNTRRDFLQSAAVTTGFAGLSQYLSGIAAAQEVGIGPGGPTAFTYGPLIPDPEGLFDLPEGFRYTVLSRTGYRMSDGYKVPGQPDGMAAFDLPGGKVALVRNHEIGHSGYTLGPFEDNTKLPDGFNPARIYDGGHSGAQPFVGGTTTVVMDRKSGKVLDSYLSLVGTDRNCAGGPTPWGSWVTCEEPADLTTQWGIRHGYCFEVPAKASPGLVEPIALKAMGRFRHEAIAVDPRTGIVYLTEDRPDGALYRFIPTRPGKLAEGGKLQALSLIDGAPADTRNWPGGKSVFPVKERFPVNWVDLEEVDSPQDDLRLQAIAKGAAIFSRGEGMWFGSAEQVGANSIYFACTDGGREHLGQIFRYFPSENEGKSDESKQPGEIELFLEPNNTELLRNADNLTIAPSGNLYICEDTSGTNRLRCVSPGGAISTFGANRLNESELAGVCFQPDGKRLFVNIQNPGITLSIEGPFDGV